MRNRLIRHIIHTSSTLRTDIIDPRLASTGEQEYHGLMIESENGSAIRKIVDPSRPTSLNMQATETETEIGTADAKGSEICANHHL
jgi:hypothetical protein